MCALDQTAYPVQSDLDLRQTDSSNVYKLKTHLLNC